MVVRISGRDLWVFACCVAMISCGDPGYSFGRADERIADVAEAADRYCERAMECAPRAVGRDVDFCRINIIGQSLSLDEKCQQAFRAVVDCAERSPCIEFPILFDRFVGGCSHEVEAFKTCDQPATGSDRRKR